MHPTRAVRGFSQRSATGTVASQESSPQMDPLRDGLEESNRWSPEYSGHRSAFETVDGR
jgi:hypothetical protein